MIRKIFGILAVFILLFAAVLHFFAPNVPHELKNRWAMLRAGVHTLHWGDERGIERKVGETTQSSRLCLFLIHGMADSVMTWRAIFTRPSEKFPQPLRLYAFDLPRGGDRDQVSQIARRYLEFLRASECKETWVIGNSFGGWIALWMGILATDADRVTRVVSLGGTGLRSVKKDDAFFEALEKDPSVENLKEFQRRAYFKPPPHPESFWTEVSRRAKESQGAVRLSRLQNENQYLDRKGPPLRAKLTYIWGEADQIVPKEMGVAVRKRFPGTELKILKKCGHLPQKECPDELLTELFR